MKKLLLSIIFCILFSVTGISANMSGLHPFTNTNLKSDAREEYKTERCVITYRLYRNSKYIKEMIHDHELNADDCTDLALSIIANAKENNLELKNLKVSMISKH